MYVLQVNAYKLNSLVKSTISIIPPTKLASRPPACWRHIVADQWSSYVFRPHFFHLIAHPAAPDIVVRGRKGERLLCWDRGCRWFHCWSSHRIVHHYSVRPSTLLSCLASQSSDHSIASIEWRFCWTAALPFPNILPLLPSFSSLNFAFRPSIFLPNSRRIWPYPKYVLPPLTEVA
jgi:hypothetical protein